MVRVCTFLCLTALACSSPPPPSLLVTARVTTAPETGGDVTRVELEASLLQRTGYQFIESPGVLGFPVVGELRVPRGVGALTVRAKAFDATGAQVDEGAATLEVQADQGRVEVTVALQRPSPTGRLRATQPFQLAPATLVGASAAVTAQFENLGHGPVTPALVAVGDVDDFTVTGCDAPVDGLGRCDVSVVFHPRVAGRRRVELREAGGSTAVVEGDGFERAELVVVVDGAQGNTVRFLEKTCPGDCTAVVDASQLVSFFAQPDRASVFVGWSEPECVGRAPVCIVPVIGPRRVTAHFARVQAPLTVRTPNAKACLLGPEARCCSNTTCTWWLPVDTELTLTANTADDIGLEGWSGCDSVVERECRITLRDSHQVSTETATVNPVFVTPVVDGGITSLAAADAECTAWAGRFSLGAGPWVAWLSSSTQTAASRLGNARGFRTLGNDIFADTLTQLGDSPFRGAQEATYEPGESYITGTRADGGLGNNCSDFSDAGTVTVGNSALTRTGWTEAGERPCDAPMQLLCVRTLTRTIPPARELVPDTAIFVSRGLLRGDELAARGDELCRDEAIDAGLRSPVSLLAGIGAVSFYAVLTPWAYRVDGVPLYDTASGDVPPLAPLNLTADGREWVGLERVWSGTNRDAAYMSPTAADHCANWTTSGTTGRVTIAASQGDSFVSMSQRVPCSTRARVFCGATR